MRSVHLLLLVVAALHSCRCFLPSSVPWLGARSKYKPDENGRQAMARASSSKVQDGSLVEYISAKGSKRLALVNKTIGAHLEVVNDAKKTFSVPLSRVTYRINGTYQFGDLLRLNDVLFDLKAAQAERVWEEACSRSMDLSNINLTISYVCERVYGVVEPIKIYATIRLMNTFGTVFFQQVNSNDLALFQPLESNVVQGNLHDRAALREFKQRYSKLNVGRSSMMSNNEMNIDVPDRILAVIAKYSEGLKQIILKSHPWHAKGLARRRIAPDLINKGKELLEYLELAPTAKNAKKVLEIINIWPAHSNVEKYIMNLRDEFPSEVNDEAQYLLDNSNMIPDPDERLRRDLRYLGCYAIDSEGTSEVDDAISIEYLDNGQEKLWVHIADVSRWIRPGSQLSIEAERRMVTVYMPDERISMFPDVLSTELLSLGAGVESYALSLGVTLSTETGEVLSYEICPSKVTVTRRVTYVQLEEILKSPLNSGAAIDDKKVHDDLNNLNRWANTRHQYRIRRGCLDEYVRDKTDLILSVKKEKLNTMNRMSVTAYPVWNNATANSMVTEYMILMCDTIGKICTTLKAPVWYKVQSAIPVLTVNDTALRHNETSFFRTIRLMRHLKSATDKKIPGPHCTSGADAYVQCTSPIRRYHDLYNHYRLKAAMHGASLSQEWADNAKDEAGINKLDKMATAEERMATLNVVRLVTRQRQLYWLQLYIDKLCSNTIGTMLRSPVLDCVVAEKHTSSYGDESIEMISSYEEESLTTVNSSHDIIFYDVHIIQLGSFNTYKLFSSHHYQLGDTLKGYLYKRHTNPISYVVIPETISLSDLPPAIVTELTPPTN